MNIFIKNKRGFTLMEVMAVVILIGILTAAGVPYYKDHVERQKSVIGITSLRMFADSVERYMALHNNNIPTDFTLLDVDMDPSNIGDGGESYSDGVFVYKIVDGHVQANRNGGLYILYFALGDNPEITCSSDSGNYCQDKLNIKCHNS